MLHHSKCIYLGVHLNLLRGVTTTNTDITTTREERNRDNDCPDFSVLPDDSSGIPINSPYYLYNVDPTRMSNNFMRGVISFQRKKQLRKEKRNRTEKQDVDIVEKKKKRREHRFNLLDCNALPHRIAIDFSFSHLMNSIEMSQNAKQLLHVLNTNSVTPTPIQLHVTNYQGCITQHVLHNGKKLRPDSVHVSPYHLTEVFKRKEVVYLSGDSDNVLETIDPSLVYIIGGLVDSRRNIKGASVTAATDAGVRHARLPLPEYIIQDTPRPIPLNQIFCILLKYIISNNWLYAISSTIPPKRIVAVKVRTPLGTHK